MTLDLTYVQQVEKTGIPILRFYGWQPFCISLGHHQNPHTLDTNKLKKAAIDVVRRPTGGSAIYHADELTYSLIVPNSNISHHDLYDLFHSNLALALSNLGIKVRLESNTTSTDYLSPGNENFACFNRAAKSEIKANGKKVVGSAQKIFKNSILQHGSILLGNEHEKIISFLKMDEKEQLFQQSKLKQNSISIMEISSVKPKWTQIADALILILQKSLNISNIFYKYTETEELKSALNFFDKVKVHLN